MDINSYVKQTLPFKIKLRAGQEFTGKYLPNFLNGQALAELESRVSARAAKEDDDAGTSVAELYESYLDHLVIMLDDVDLTKDKKKIPFGTEEEKRAALSIFSYDDLIVITRGLNDHVANPLDETGTDSSAGQPPKEESTPA